MTFECDIRANPAPRISLGVLGDASFSRFEEFISKSLTKIEMRDMTQCEEVAQKWLNTKKINTKKNLRGYECLEGK